MRTAQRSLRFPMPTDPRAVPAARRTADDACRLWTGLELPYDAQVLVSEVVTNAVRHARTGAVLLVVSCEGDALRVEVHDGDATLPRRRRTAAHELGGRGLTLLSRLAKRWGVERQPGGGKVVWFESQVSPPAVAGSSER